MTIFGSKKRILAAAVAMGLAATLAACTSGPAPTDSEAGGDKSLQGSTDENYTMVTFLSGLEFWKETYRGFEDAAALLGVSTNYAGTTEYDVNLAISELEQVMATQPDGIAVTAMDEEAYIAPINQAIAAGIPTVTFDSDSPRSDRLSFLGTGNYNAGAVAARELGALYPDGESADVGIITILGSSNVRDRLRGFEETLAAEFPNLTIVQTVDSGADEGTAATAAANLLQANPGIDAVFATLTLALVGTMQAISEAGLEDIKVFTFDAEQVTLEGIKAGTVEFTVAQGPYNMGYWSMMMLYAAKHQIVEPVENWAEYGIAPLPPVVDTGAFLINTENVDAYLGE